MTAGRCDQQEIPLRDHLVETQGKQLAGLQIGQGKILHHAADTQERRANWIIISLVASSNSGLRETLFLERKSSI